MTFADKLVLVAAADVRVLDRSDHLLHDKPHTYIHIPVRQLLPDHRKVPLDQ